MKDRKRWSTETSQLIWQLKGKRSFDSVIFCNISMPMIGIFLKKYSQFNTSTIPGTIPCHTLWTVINRLCQELAKRRERHAENSKRNCLKSLGLDILLTIFTILLMWWSLHGNVLRRWNRLKSGDWIILHILNEQRYIPCRVMMSLYTSVKVPHVHNALDVSLMCYHTCS